MPLPFVQQQNIRVVLVRVCVQKDVYDALASRCRCRVSFYGYLEDAARLFRQESAPKPRVHRMCTSYRLGIFRFRHCCSFYTGTNVRVSGDKNHLHKSGKRTLFPSLNELYWIEQSLLAVSQTCQNDYEQTSASRKKPVTWRDSFLPEILLSTLFPDCLYSLIV